jgi:hypothetical protein
MPDDKLIKIETGKLQKYDDEAFAVATKAGDFLPRLQLMIANSDPCKEGKFPINHYAVVSGQTFKDVGETVDVLVITWRPKALELGDEIISVYDPNHNEFLRIQEKSGESDSGCMFGPEFLCWVPKTKEFVTFFMGNKSSRREAPNMKARLQMAATLKSHQIKTKKYAWFAPIITPCSTPINPLPDMGDLQSQVDKFNNPPETEIERVEATDKEERAR